MPLSMAASSTSPNWRAPTEAASLAFSRVISSICRVCCRVMTAAAAVVSTISTAASVSEILTLSRARAALTMDILCLLWSWSSVRGEVGGCLSALLERRAAELRPVLRVLDLGRHVVHELARVREREGRVRAHAPDGLLHVDLRHGADVPRERLRAAGEERGGGGVRGPEAGRRDRAAGGRALRPAEAGVGEDRPGVRGRGGGGRGGGRRRGGGVRPRQRLRARGRLRAAAV